MRRLAPHLAPLGYSPRRYAPLSPAPVLGMGERLTDLRDIQALFANGEQGGYWPADPAYAYEDSAGTIPASVNGVVGYRADVACGKHAIQATTANKPYLRRTPATGKTWYDSNTATGALTATFSGSLGSSCTIATVTPEGVVIADNQTVGTTYNIAPPYGYSSDVLIINRALTAAEKALVTRVMQQSVPMLGSEIVTNGGFDTSDTWVVNASSTGISDGAVTVTSLPGNAGVSQSKNYLWQIGDQVYLTYTILSPNVGNCPNYIETNGLGGLMQFADTGISGVGVKKFARKVTNRASYISFMTAGTIIRSFVLDNVSAKAIL